MSSPLHPEQFRIIHRPGDVRVGRSWGDEWHEIEGYGILHGPPVPREELPQTLYHVTTNYPAVMRSGYLRASSGEGAAGLGGGHKDTVSLTVDRDIAEGLKHDMRDYAVVATSGSPEGMMDYFHREYGRLGMRNFEDMQSQYDVNSRSRESNPASWGHSAFTQFFTSRSIAGRGRNPIIVGGVSSPDSPWWSQNPEDIEVVHVPRSSIPREALISSFDLHRSLRGDRTGLKEVRVHADIPLR